MPQNARTLSEPRRGALVATRAVHAGTLKAIRFHAQTTLDLLRAAERRVPANRSKAAVTARDALQRSRGFIVVGLDLLHAAFEDPANTCRNCREALAGADQ